MGLPLQGEVAQDTEAESLTFLGVELGANNIPFAGSGSEAEAVVAVGAHNGIVFRLRVVRVDKIDVGILGKPVPERVRPVDEVECVPAHVRYFEIIARESDNLACQDS